MSPIVVSQLFDINTRSFHPDQSDNIYLGRLKNSENEVWPIIYCKANTIKYEVVFQCTYSVNDIMLKIWLAHTPNANDLFYCCFSRNWFFTQFTARRIQYQISVLHAQAVNSRSSIQYISNSWLTISKWCSPICDCYICEIFHGGRSSICRLLQITAASSS